MIRIVLLMLILFVSGCAAFRGGNGGIARDKAQAMLESRDRAGAARVLTTITESKGVAGVTDEALFRLALLSLHPVTEKEGNLPALQLLKRLKREYPDSIWTQQSVPLLEMLTGAEELRRQIRSLKANNQSLVNEVNELNRSIERLKRLDQELEKARR